MINLNSTTQSLQVVLAAAKTTNDCPIYVSKLAGGSNTSVAKAVNTNGTTAVTIMAAPESHSWKSLRTMMLYNADTAAILATVQVVDTAVGTMILGVFIIPVGQTLIYEDQLGFMVVGNAAANGRLTTLASQATLFNTYTTAKTIIPAANVIALPANFWQVGKQLRIRVVGGLSNIVTTPGTITFQVMIGSVIVFTTGAIQLNATAHTLLPFILDILMTCRAIGSGTTAKFQGNGFIQGIQPTLTAGQTDAANTGGIFSVPATAPALGTGFDSTAAGNLDFWAGFSISNAGNGVQVEQYTVDVN